MPCSDSGLSREDAQRELRDHQTMTRLACDRCRELETKGLGVPLWALEWWKEHQRKDAKCLEEESAAKKAVIIRNRAIAKLTPEEREELGV